MFEELKAISQATDTDAICWIVANNQYGAEVAGLAAASLEAETVALSGDAESFQYQSLNSLDAYFVSTEVI